jgi:hypothetical protein
MMLGCGAGLCGMRSEEWRGLIVCWLRRDSVLIGRLYLTYLEVMEEKGSEGKVKEGK